MSKSEAAGLSLTDAQRDGIERTDLSMAVTSGAGCGKTFVLTRRYLKALADDGAPDAPTRVVAVTFTEKAAIEMHQRVAAELTERIAATDDPEAKTLLGEWLNRLPDARISTIHGFCTSLLRAHAVDAGVDPGFAVLADAFDVQRMRGEVCGETVRAACQDVEGGAAELLGYFSYDQILGLLAELLEQRWRWSAADYADPAATEACWAARLADARQMLWDAFGPDAVRREVDALDAEPCDDRADKLAAYMREQLAAMRLLLDDPTERRPEAFAGLKSAGGKGGAKAWGSKDRVKDVRGRLKLLVDRFKKVGKCFSPLNDADALSARCLQTLTTLADEAARRYAVAKRRAGVLDFVDLLVLTRDLLRDVAVRKAVAGQIRHLLIDEFQDTDSLQHELLYAAVDCVGGSPPPGRVFFVGDAKQSIYRFRGAEVEVFAAAREAIGQANARNLDLSFRTHASGVELVNDMFGPLMGAGYEPLRAHRAERPPHSAAEVLLAEWRDGMGAAGMVADAARAMAGRIAEMIGAAEPIVWDRAAGQWRPVAAGDIAILLPRLQNTAPYEEALHDVGIDYYVVAGAGLFRQQEVFDLTNALRAIDNPLDDIALMGFLRGGMVGLDDNALLHLADVVGPPYRGKLRDAAVAGRLGAAAAARLTGAADVLDMLSARKDAHGVDELLGLLLGRTGFAATLLGQYQGRRKCGNVHRVAALARSARESGATLRQFVEFLMTQTFEEVRAEQAATEAEGGDVVRIMTIHKAKGLEFPVVFLGDLNYAPQQRRAMLGVRGSMGLTLKVSPDDGDADPQSWAVAAGLDSLREDGEKLRAFYVAVTRHSDYVAFVGAAQVDGDCYGKTGSMLRRLDDALGLADGMAAGEIRLADGAAVTARTVALKTKRRDRAKSWLDDLYARCDSPQALADLMATPAAKSPRADALPFLGSVDATGVERLAVTALAEFEHCPACFRWHYELRVPAAALATGRTVLALTSGPPVGGDAAGAMDAATAGTVFHRCMELLDFAAPQPAEHLMRRALAEQEVDIDPAPMARDLAGMINRLRSHELWPMLIGARRRLAELEFVSLTGRLELTGVIDLLCEDAAGTWHVVDYKSDRVACEHIAAHAERYELQMLIYAAAAGRFLRGLPDGDAPDGIDATLYFLRPGVSHVFDAAALTAGAAAERLAGIASRLTECRCTGHWPRRQDAACAHCRYSGLCKAGRE